MHVSGLVTLVVAECKFLEHTWRSSSTWHCTLRHACHAKDLNVDRVFTRMSIWHPARQQIEALTQLKDLFVLIQIHKCELWHLRFDRDFVDLTAVDGKALYCIELLVAGAASAQVQQQCSSHRGTGLTALIGKQAAGSAYL